MPEPTTVITDPNQTKVQEPAKETTPNNATPPAPANPAPSPDPAKPVEPAKPAEPVKPAEVKYELKYDSSKLAKEDVDRISAQAKEKGLSNDQAQMLLDAEVNGAAKYAERELQRMKGESTKWIETLKADKEIGGEFFDKSIENAKRVIQKYADQEFKDFLNNSGMGNHPTVVRIFAKIGKAFGEDHWVDGSVPSPKQTKSAAEIMYDKTK